MSTKIFIGTSGWHYSDWIGSFYPADIKGYDELKYHATVFNTVENNSSFYHIPRESTYKTWYKITHDNYVFSIKLNKLITHIHHLELTEGVQEKIFYILQTTQVLKQKLGCIVIQLPPSFRYDLQTISLFFDYFMDEVHKLQYKPDIAIEFRNKYWFTQELFSLLKKYNVALVAGQSSRYPECREITADCTYIRMHGPEKLFASSYSTDQLQELANYIHKVSPQLKKVYVYFNNDYYGYAINNAKELKKITGSEGK